MIKSDTIATLLASLFEAQQEFPTIPKRSVNPFFSSTFADLATIKEFVDPILAKRGLSISQQLSSVDGKSAVTTLLFHRDGEYLGDTTPLSQVKSGPQDQGSAITYLRRYAYSSVLNLVSEDDDGNQASQANPAELSKALDRLKEAAARSSTSKDEVEKLFFGKYKVKLADSQDVAAVNALADHLTEKAVADEVKA